MFKREAPKCARPRAFAQWLIRPCLLVVSASHGSLCYILYNQLFSLFYLMVVLCSFYYSLENNRYPLQLVTINKCANH